MVDVNHTKIICTIGPSCQSVEQMMALIEAGMNVARLNFSHGTHEEHLVSINNLKEARRRSQKPLAILMDTKGPEIRVGRVKGSGFAVKPGDKLFVSKEPVEGSIEGISLTPALVFDYLKPGMTLLIDNGYISSRVMDVSSEGATIEIENGGLISNNKGINIPGHFINLPAVTEKDVSDIRFALAEDIDMIAASFVRSKEHVEVIKLLCMECNKPETLVIAKIENYEGVEHFDEIVQVADGIMVARGDLGVELPVAMVPRLQKKMIREAYLSAKPVITATQMLETMITNPRPTRAEVSDVANAIYDSTSAVMLSGETAVGKYPIDTVKMMRLIVGETESDFKYQEFFYNNARRVYNDIPSSVTLAAVNTAYSADAKAIFASTKTGLTARLLSSLRPKIPIIALTTELKIYHQLALYWGVIPVYDPDVKDYATAFDALSFKAKEMGIVNAKDLVVVISGSVFGETGSTNMMIVERLS